MLHINNDEVYKVLIQCKFQQKKIELSQDF
jgi:hypothetical protein